MKIIFFTALLKGETWKLSILSLERSQKLIFSKASIVMEKMSIFFAKESEKLVIR